MINAVTTSSLPRACTVEEVKNATDTTLQAVIESLQSGAWNKDLGPFYPHRNEFSFSDGILLRNDRIVIPQSLRQRILTLAHQGHQGIAKTKASLRTKVWWPAMSDAERFVKQCQPCLVTTESPKPNFTPLKPTTLPKAAWLLIGMDFVGPFPTEENLFVLVDYYSRYPEVEIMKPRLRNRAFVESLHATEAVVTDNDGIVTDNAKTFRPSRFSNLMREFGIKHRRITPRYPRANGEAERLNRSINEVVKTAIAESRDWRKAIDDWLLAYRTTPHTVTGQPPAATMFGRNVNDKFPSLQPSAPIKINRTSYRQHDVRNKQKGKNYHDAKKKAQHCSIKVGDQVLIRSEKKGKVTLPWRANPFLVRAVKGDSVPVEDGNRQRLMRHSTAVKKLPITAGTTTLNGPATPPETVGGQRPRRSTKKQPEYYGFNSTA